MDSGAGGVIAGVSACRPERHEHAVRESAAIKKVRKRYFITNSMIKNELSCVCNGGDSV